MAGVAPTETRSAKYNAKYDPTTVGLKVAARLPGMKSGFQAAIEALVPIEQQIQGILNDAEGVPIIQYPFYLSFGREIWGRTRRGIAGPTLDEVTQIMADKWVTWGLDCSILATIALNVFGITVTCATP